MKWDDLQAWQPLIGTIVGFGALTWGALYNYHLGRKRDDAIRERESLSVALGLYSEIGVISKELANLANGLGRWFARSGSLDAPAHLSDSYVLPEPVLYKALAPKFGMIAPGLLTPIASFYGLYCEAVAHFPKVLESEERKISYGVEWVLQPAIDAIEVVQPALREIERVSGLAVATPPDLSKARNGLEIARDFHEPYD